MIGNMEILFLAFTFALCGNEKHVLVRGLLFDSGPLSSSNDINKNTDHNNNSIKYNNNINNDHSAIDLFQNKFISGSRDNRPMTYAQRDYVTSFRSKNHNSVDNLIRRRQHRHKQSVTMNEQSPLSKEHKIGDNMPLREQDGGRKLSGQKLQGQMMNYELQHQAGSRSDDIKNAIDSKHAPDDMSNSNIINNSIDDGDGFGGETSEDQKQRLARERKERMKKYWEKRKQFYEKRKKVVKEKKTGSDQSADDKSKRQRSSEKLALATSGEDGAEKNSPTSPDGANARKWRQSESENHSVQYREHLKRQIYRADDDDDDDDDDNDVSMASEHRHHHHHHHGNHRSGRHDRRCDAKICRNDGICNEAQFATGGVANNVTSQKKCLCRLGTAGQHCEKTDVSVKYPKFHGYGFIAFPTLRDSYREFSFRLEFRPEAANGLLLFASDHVDASHDFFSVNLIDGRVEFRFDCGTGLGRIRTEKQVELRAWNSLEILRKESEAELRLNSDQVLKGRSKGDYTKMTFRDHLFLGGHRNMTHAARYSGAKTGFVGCIRRLEVKDRKYDMRRGAFVGDALYGLDVEECDGHECERVKCHNGGTCINKEVDSYVCLCRLGNVGKNCERKADVTMPSFSDMSYLQYVGLRRTVLNFLQIEIVFLPRSSNGMLLFNGFSPDGFGDFVSLALINSTVEFRFDLGTGPAVIKGRNSLALNEWHTLKAWRDGKNGHLQVDGDMEVTGTSRGAFTQLTLALDLFVGGHRNFDEVTRNAFVSSSFDGCIQKLVINERPIKLIHESLGGVNIGECSAHPCSSKRPCLNGGKCIAILDKYKCDCLPGFQDDHCQGRAARYRYRYKRSSNQEDNPMPKFEGNSYMLITRYDVVSKTRGSSCDLEMRIKAQKNTSGLIFFVSNQIDDTLEFPTTSPTTTITTQDTTKATTTSNPGSYGKIYTELFNEDFRNGFPFKSADEDLYPDDFVSELESSEVKNNPQSVTKDDDGGYEDDEVNDAYYYHGNAANDVDDYDVESHSSRPEGKSGDFFMVGLVDGFVTAEFSLGQGSGKLIFNKSKVDDGLWHSVRVHRLSADEFKTWNFLRHKRGREATLEVDGSEIIKVTCPGRAEQLFTDGTVYIGGLPNVEQRTSGRYSSGFHGCIGHISLSSGQLVDLFKMADVASNVSLCQDI